VRSWDGDRHAELVELDDQETLEKAVAEKALEYNSNKPTEIVCVL
jgi:hypothetical protein